MQNNNPKILFLGLGLLLLIPLVQQLTAIVEINPLKGAITELEKPGFSINKWFQGEYQTEAESYLNEKFGFRNSFIRLNNQIAYSLFNKAKAYGVIIGKEDYLYEEKYINAYYGSDFVGKNHIDSVLFKVHFLQQVLKKKNIDLILIFNPGKASYYPQFIPDDRKQPAGITNHEYYVAKAKVLQVNVLDL